MSCDDVIKPTDASFRAGPLRRRAVGLALGAAGLARLAQAQGNLRRLGLLGPLAAGGPFEGPLIRGLAKHGYVPDRNIVLVRRGSRRLDALPGLVAELVANGVELILTFGYDQAVAARQGTRLPVLVYSAGDPVAVGLVDSLARPGGHLTGISDVSAEVTPKRLDLLKQFAPEMRNVAVLYNADDKAMVLRYEAAIAAARALGVSLRPLGVRQPADFGEAFAAMNRNLPDAILMVSDPLTNLNRDSVFAFAQAHRLPGIYEYDYIARTGGLMSYGPDLDESFDRMGALVDRVLHGANAGELPFEQPTLFKFVLNLKAARAIGFEAPPALLARADEVIE